jgi:hypothetical protein
MTDHPDYQRLVRRPAAVTDAAVRSHGARTHPGAVPESIYGPGLTFPLEVSDSSAVVGEDRDHGKSWAKAHDSGELVPPSALNDLIGAGFDWFLWPDWTVGDPRSWVSIQRLSSR